MSEPLVIVERNEGSQFVTLKLNNKPMNALTLELFNEINVNLDKIELDESIHGIILTSNINGIFSVGLSPTEIIKIDKARCGVFIRAFQNLWIKLYGSKKVVIAAINGVSPSGGCVMSLACDYRIMANGPFKIGINETQIGIPPPFWICDGLIATIGVRNGEKALMFGEYYSSEQALKINLIDEVVDLQNLKAKSEEKMLELLKTPNYARMLTKLSLRKSAIDKLKKSFNQAADDLVNLLAQESTQAAMIKYIQSKTK